MFGSQLLPAIRQAIAAGLDPVSMSGAALFADNVRDDIAALAEAIIPETDTPGAREAGVADFIEYMLQEFYPADDRHRFEAGAESLAAMCNAEYGRRFAALPADKQFAVVQTLHDGTAQSFDDGGKAFFEHAKQLTVFGYYTSEIGMTVERRYLPVPGRYDGAYPYENVRTLFTS